MTEIDNNLEIIKLNNIIIEKDKKIKILEEKLKMVYEFLNKLENIHFDD